MTLVGPRPESVELARRYPTELRFVLEARPGLTGPTQLRFRERSATPPPGWDVDEWYLARLVPRRVASDLTFLERPTLGRTLGYLTLTGLQLLGLRSPPSAVEPVPQDRLQGR
jgi:lipopolysaccharide/colanic/teichoic acid biosynthesis glycosyltransferase